MAKGAEKIRKKGLQGIDFAPVDPLTARATKKQAQRLDTKLQKKGAFFESNLAEQQRSAEKAKKQQEQAIGRQRQAEELRLAESESEVQRRRFLRTTGGRRSLIASR